MLMVFPARGCKSVALLPHSYAGSSYCCSAYITFGIRYMRRSVFFVFLLFPALAVASVSKASGASTGVYDGTIPRQDATLRAAKSPDPDRFRKVGFGFKIGLNLSNLNFNRGFPKPAVPVESTWGIGFEGGFLLEVPLRNKLHLQQEYLYTHVEGEVESGGKPYTLKYISLPVVLKYKFLPQLSLMAGPQFDLLLHAVEKHGSNSIGIIHDTEERNIGAVVGLEYKPSAKVALETRFMQGINHIGMRQRRTDQEFKLQSFSISVILTLFN